MMESNVLPVLRGSQCESVPFEQDLHLSRSLVETCTRFLACMVDTQDYICQLKNTYVKELWPKVCAEVTESNFKVIRLEKELADCKKEKEESRQSYMQQLERFRMTSEDERSHWVREIDSLHDRLRRQGEGRCELIAGSEEGSLRTPNHAAIFEFMDAESHLLHRRIEACDQFNSELSTSNEDIRKQLLIRTEEIEELKRALERARMKKQFREHQMLLQKDSEDRYTRARRLSLRKQRHSQSKSVTQFGSWIGEQGVEDGSWKELHSVHDPGILQPVANFHSSVGEPKTYDVSVPFQKSPASSPTNIRSLAPGIKRIDLEVDAGTFRGKLPEHSIGAVEWNAKICEGTSVARSVNSIGGQCRAVEARQGSLQSDETTEGGTPRVDAENQNVQSVSLSAQPAEVPAIPFECLGAVSAGNAIQPSTSVSCNSSLNEDLAVHKTSGLAGMSRVNGEVASSSRAKKCLSVDTGLKQRHKTSVSDTIKNPTEQQSGTSTHNNSGKKSKERKWRNTRSRTEGVVEDHDSFLNTPRDLVMANLKSRGESNEVQQEPAELCHQSRNKRPSPPPVSSNRGKTETDLAAKYEWTDECELKDKQSVGFKAIGKSKGSTERDENVEKSSGPSSGTRTSTGDKERQGPRSRVPGYKFNEPVRKKREREQLEATDCVQCRKFYDAVLAEDAEGVTMDRCEHHDAVSRHRYKYLPPGTPAGFWNIGFDSEF